MLKSNGLRHSKNLPVKFGFSPRTVPANIAKKLPAQRCSKPHFIAFFNLSHKRPTFAFVGESGYTRHPSPEPRTQRLARRNRGRFGWGWYHCSARSPTSPGRVSERQTLPLLGLGRVCSRRTQKAFGTAMRMMRVAVPKASRPRWAALLCLQFGDVAVFSLCAQGFPHMQKRVWYHYPRRAPRVVETLDGRLSKGLICHFSRSGGLH